VLDANFLSALDIEAFENQGLITAGCKQDRPAFLWKDSLANIYLKVTQRKREIMAACTKNNGIVKLASNYLFLC